MRSELTPSRGLPFALVAVALGWMILDCEHPAARQRQIPGLDEFKTVAKQEARIQDSDLMSIGADSQRPVASFVRMHPESTRLYLQILDEAAHAQGGEDLDLLLAALRGIEFSRDSAAQKVLEEMANDPKVHTIARDEVLRALVSLPGVIAVKVYGDQLLDERDPGRRGLLCYKLLQLADPAGIPYLERARDQETLVAGRLQFELGIELLRHPTQCSLAQQADLGAGKWECVYRCPGPQDMFVQPSSEACPQRAAVPRRR